MRTMIGEAILGRIGAQNRVEGEHEGRGLGMSTWASSRSGYHQNGHPINLSDNPALANHSHLDWSCHYGAGDM